MARLPEWCEEAALVHWFHHTEEPPSWPEAHRRLQGEGRCWEGQLSVRGATPVRDLRTSGERRTGIRVMAAMPCARFTLE